MIYARNLPGQKIFFLKCNTLHKKHEEITRKIYDDELFKYAEYFANDSNMTTQIQTVRQVIQEATLITPNFETANKSNDQLIQNIFRQRVSLLETTITDTIEGVKKWANEMSKNGDNLLKIKRDMQALIDGPTSTPEVTTPVSAAGGGPSTPAAVDTSR